MCVSKSWVRNPYTGQMIYVICGHCPACQQSKANARMSKIISHVADRDYVQFFITLDYSNSYVPYVSSSDIASSAVSIPVRRKQNIRTVYSPKTKKYIQKIEKDVVLTTVDRSDLPSWSIQDYYKSCLPLKGQGSDIVGVHYHQDFANFIKRLRYYLDAYYGLKLHSYYRTEEYGPTTHRPHIHAILFFEKTSALSDFKVRRAVIKSWPYCALHRWQRNFQRAISVAKYLSQYVNTPGDFPEFLRLKSFRPKSTHSKGFGFGRKEFSVRSVFDNVSRGSSLYRLNYMQKNGVERTLVLPYPAYVVRRFFPKFKGYCNIGNSSVYNSIVSVLQHLSLCESLRCTVDEVHQWHGRIIGAYRRFYNAGLVFNIYDYARLYVKFYSVRWSDLYRLSYQGYTSSDVLFHFDNVDYILRYSYLLDTFDSFPERLIHDPNDFPLNIQQHQRLLDDYNKNIKIRKFSDYERSLRYDYDYQYLIKKHRQHAKHFKKA